MQDNQILKKLETELEVTSMGDHRKFKFVNNHLQDEKNTIKFFVKVLGYKTYQANKVWYNVLYAKKRYQEKLILRQ